ncbi:YcxB family protein [Streptomyces sp. NPDC057543]|uniref:YcxB family protein n=1 Tax=Streptomyces sp. NPDC057543 TaxID=3346163 RepID=UPI003678791E
MTTQGRDGEAEAVAGEEAVVELEYQPTRADFTGALQARARASAAGRRQRVLMALLAVMAVLTGALTVLDGDVLWLVLCALCVTVVVALPLTLRLTGRQLHRFAALQGMFRSHVYETGIRIVTEQSTMTVRWSVMPCYRETPELFVLLSDDKQATGLTLLPKRGLRDPGDLDRLRAVLDRHLRRF